MTLLLIAAALIAISSVFSLYKHFQMLQQNSYFPSRYLKWIKSSFALRTILSAMLFFALLFLLSLGSDAAYIIITAVCGVLLVIKIFSAFSSANNSIKPLVFTGRVKRLFGAALLLLCCVLALIVLLPRHREIFAGILFCLCSVPSVLCLVCRSLCLPLEKAFNHYYINDAKKILSSQKGLTVIGITGSYGKTTTKFILNRILSEKYNTVCTPQSYNTTLGVVRTVREKIKPQSQMFVCEMGAKNKGDIKEICNIVKPDCGIITSVGEQHLDTFKTVDNVFSTKFELCDSIEKKNGFCLVNTDSPGIALRINTKPFATPFGEGTNYYVNNIKSSPAGSTFLLHINGEEISLRTKLLGRHSITDIAAAAVMAHKLGVSAGDIRSAVAALQPAEHRLELKPYYAGSMLIDDAYNSNPEGCLEALCVLGSFEGMRKTVITPGLIELGEKEYEANFELGNACAKWADDIILVGERYAKPVADAVMKSDFDKSRLKTAASFKEALGIYLEYADKNCVLLIENDLPDNYLK